MTQQQPIDDGCLRDWFAAKIEVDQIEWGSTSMAVKEDIVGRACPPEKSIERMQWYMELDARLRYMKADAMMKARTK